MSFKFDDDLLNKLNPSVRFMQEQVEPALQPLIAFARTMGLEVYCVVSDPKGNSETSTRWTVEEMK